MKKVIVIGSGILGASTAYHLAKMGADVLVVDRKDKGQATDAAAGIICPWLSQRRNQAWYRLAKAGARYYPELIAQLRDEGETDTGYAQVGALSIHHDMMKLGQMEERAKLRKTDAPEIGDVTRLNTTQTRELFPLLAEDYSSIHISGAARVDGRALRDALIRSAQHNGAVIVSGEARLEHLANRVTGVNVGAQHFSADLILVCAGAWANLLLQPLGIDFKVHFQKAQIVHLEVPDRQDTDAWPVVIPPNDQYLLSMGSRRIVIGSTHENDIEGYDTRITAGGIQEILNKGIDLAPGLANSTFLETRVGFRPFTPGFLPVIGNVPGWEGLLTANGLGASGLTMGPYLGRQLARMALEREMEIDVSDYDIRNAVDQG
ncbi:oxidoreductase [Paenibacillus sp. P3E]|uniref:NAD(P)/FAD-dependent oxidoreductase n=1 Tax=unclassified Paenibacillus TaxID=185978 RepID=UPI00093BC85A|nr:MULTISPECIES: FAD-binding oxidoreductase [unclassified Paenibacillus]OKP77106.1 oxidoreductase [Paenibacillus sp. P3E]OKP93904.1 oxidoreductase [Paenibacillus sp. P32E]